MTFRGYFSLNGIEIANSSRVVAHLGSNVPLTDAAIFGGGGPGSFIFPAIFPAVFGTVGGEDCRLIPSSPGLYGIPASSVAARPGLYTPPDGSRQFGPGLFEVNECWGPATICSDCTTIVGYDDSWPGLQNFLGDNVYRPELAPWYTTELPESGEFAGVWIMNITGLDTTPVQREITQAVGSGGVAAPHRDAARSIEFEALLIGCTSAGVDFGLKWLTCLLRDTNDNTGARMRFLTSHPGHSAISPATLLREAQNVVLTKAPEITETVNLSGRENQQGTLYKVTWGMGMLSPYVYLPSVSIPVDWDIITRQPINWIHAADCHRPETCADMPVMFSTECVPEEIQVVDIPPPVCGGCLPVSAIDKYMFRVPTMDFAFRCRETAVTLVLRNNGVSPLTCQAFWRVCGTDVRCEDNQFPVQISGLPPSAELHLDGVTGRFWAFHDEHVRRPVGVVGTPNGAPWLPPVIDRRTCWDFIIQAPGNSDFEVSMVLYDREP